MMNGRPDETTHYALFYPADHKQNITTPNIKHDAPGFLYHSGQTNKENLCHGKGKFWYDDGDIFIGE
jgi:hypothetical protein